MDMREPSLRGNRVTGAAATEAPEAAQGFQVRLSNFEGPFDLLLQLIFAHRMDVTEVALHQVTDEFIAYTKEIGRTLELDETTAFLVIAATLLDLKAARLLPSGEVHDTVKAGTAFLVAGEKVGQTKLDAAKKRGTKVITEDELYEMLGA